MLVLSLLVVSLELGLRGVLMYTPPGLVGTEALERFNRANACTPNPQDEKSGPAEHGPLCFVHLLPAEGLAPAQGRFANLRFVKRLVVAQAPVKPAFAQRVAARAPPA
ncbi:hypothetical protein [Meiothermus sp. QL-1]|uniref:hypothetical protein n=1 Tax=Meiothermus sp. QL-1 TaxID=2058095 RepID=UPI001313EE22|nr:hypothetical protein [Meiothermus sp. QL-1]